MLKSGRQVKTKEPAYLIGHAPVSLVIPSGGLVPVGRRDFLILSILFILSKRSDRMNRIDRIRKAKSGHYLSCCRSLAEVGMGFLSAFGPRASHFDPRCSRSNSPVGSPLFKMHAARVVGCVWLL